ncbi:MAG: Veg family protein [Clostridiales bacterium]|nr:Veg family protein [Clostridiales bacterium]
MRGKELLEAIKKNIDEHVGEKVLLKANSGRRKMLVREGVLEQTYPNIFVVRIEASDNTSRVVSYSYSDILTKNVQIVFENNEVAI